MESISASLAHHSEQLETLNRVTQKQLGQLQHKLSSQMKAKKNKEMSSPPKCVEGPKSEPEGPSCDRKQLLGLVERLRELEGEEELIRERWQTISYEDPRLVKHQIVQRNEENTLDESGELA